MRKRLLRTKTGTALLALLMGCNSQQSAFAPVGAEAERINFLFWIMTVGGGLILVGVMALSALAIFGRETLRSRFSSERFITSAGIVFPVVVLSVLLVYSFLVLRVGASAPPTEDGIRFVIRGEQWWWRVTYVDADGISFESANELHIPVGQSVRLELTTADVIHSFWVPSLAGKLDMIPGRTNILTITATEKGVSRGQCAEYCGGAHAFMAFYVIAHTPEDFEAWRANESGPAVKIEGERAARGARLFLNAGCGGCHTIRGTQADGVIGPDLTHVGGRSSLAAATLPKNIQAFAYWITNNQHIKPENKMPPYNIFTHPELEDLAIYLESLK